MDKSFLAASLATSSFFVLLLYTPNPIRTQAQTVSVLPPGHRRKPIPETDVSSSPTPPSSSSSFPFHPTLNSPFLLLSVLPFLTSIKDWSSRALGFLHALHDLLDLSKPDGSRKWCLEINRYM